MYAIIEFGGKQFKVSEGEIFETFPVRSIKEKKFEISPISIYDGKNLLTDKEKLKDIKVICEIIEEKKGEKIYSFKKKAKTGYKRGIGYRDTLVRIKVNKISI